MVDQNFQYNDDYENYTADVKVFERWARHGQVRRRVHLPFGSFA